MRHVKGIAGIAAAAAVALSAAPAMAQSLWGNENSVYDSGIVSFSKKYSPGQIIVSFGDRRLYYITRRGQALSYPIAVPRKQSRWQGVLRVSQKRVNPSWTPTASMRRENPKLPTFVPGGHPRNPMGVRALYLGSSLYRIHGTDAPWTIGQNVSKGCVRMHNAHVVELFKRARVGTKVTATWTRFNSSTIASASSSGGSGSGSQDWRPF